MLPSWVHLDSLALLLVAAHAEPHLLRLLDQLVCVLWMEGGKDGEEIWPRAASTLGVLVWEVLDHSRHLDAGVEQLSDGDLVVLGRVAVLDILHLHELLVALQDLLQVRRGHHVVAGHEVLPMGAQKIS